MKKKISCVYTFLIFLFMAILLSCDLSYLNEGGIVSSGPALRVEILQMSNYTGKIYRYYDINDTLVYYLEKYEDTSGRVIEVQRYDYRSVLQYIELNKYFDDTGIRVFARFNADRTMAWCNRIHVDTRARASSEWLMNDQFEITEIRRWWYADHELVPASTPRLTAYFDAQLQVQKAWLQVWNESGHLIARQKYDFVNGQLSLVSADSLEYNQQDQILLETSYTRDRVRSQTQTEGHGPSGVTLASLPTEFPIPEEPELEFAPVVEASLIPGLLVQSKTWHLHDAYGSTSASFSPHDYAGIELWRPHAFSRRDSRLARDFLVNLSYDASGRPIRKHTFYGADSILDLGLDWDSDGYPWRINLEGASLLSPQTWSINWVQTTWSGFSYKYPQRLSLSVNSVLLQYFEWDYVSGQVAPIIDASAIALLKSGQLGMDVLEFLSARHIARIRHYNGDNELLETFEFTLQSNAETSTATLRVDVKDAQGRINGSWIAAIDANGHKTGLHALNATGSELWRYEYNYAQDLSDVISWSGKVVDTFLPQGININNPLEIASNLSEALIYDLLF